MVRHRVILMVPGMLLVCIAACDISGQGQAAQRAPEKNALTGLVLGAGSPIANSTVRLWEASTDAPQKLAATRTNERGQFEIRSSAAPSDHSLYLVAVGGEPKAGNGSGINPAIMLMTVLGNRPPEKVVINEFTTVASVWTHAQFLSGTAIRGHALGLRIAAGNVPNFVDLATGGYGQAIQDALNSSQTPTMANFATLANVMAGCVTRSNADACPSFFAAATGPDGKAPANTLTAAHSIARNSAYKPARVFALLDQFYPTKE